MDNPQIILRYLADRENLLLREEISTSHIAEMEDLMGTLARRIRNNWYATTEETLEELTQALRTLYTRETGQSGDSPTFLEDLWEEMVVLTHGYVYLYNLPSTSDEEIQQLIQLNDDIQYLEEFTLKISAFRWDYPFIPGIMDLTEKIIRRMAHRMVDIHQADNQEVEIFITKCLSLP